MNKIEIIAEIANAHQGDPQTALNLAKQVLEAGADAVKFQIYFAHELLVKSHPRYNHFENQSFSPEVWRDIILNIKNTGSKVYCDVFGIEALKLAMDLEVDGFKIHSSDMGNIELLQKLASYQKSKIFLSTGGCSAREISVAIDLIGIKHRPILLHGFQSYPTAVEDSNLLRLVWLKENFGSRTDIGYQDHVDASDPFSVTLPLIAIAMGARFIEKHVTFDRSSKGVDYYSSLEPFEFKNFISEVRKTESSIGVRADSFSAAELNYRNTVKKKWVAVRKLHAGNILSMNDLCMKRVHDNGKDVLEVDKLIGRPLLRDVAEEEVVCRSDVKTVAWAIVVARSRSTRLPGKAMLDVAGMPALQHLIERLKQAQTIERILLCTTTNDEDTPLAQLALTVGASVHRGPVEDVLGRMIGALNGHEVDVVLRITGDDILVDPIYIDQGLQYHLNSNAEYSDLKALPSGTEVEFFDVKLLKEIHLLAKNPNWTEYLTFYITQNKDQFRTVSVPVEEKHSLDWRLTLDTVEDYEVIRTLLVAMRQLGKPLDYRLDDIINFFTLNPEVLAINSNVRQRQFIPQIDTTIEWNRLLKFAQN